MALFPDLIQDVATRVISAHRQPGSPPELMYVFEFDCEPCTVKASFPMVVWGTDPAEQIRGFAQAMQACAGRIPQKTPEGFFAAFYLFDLPEPGRPEVFGRVLTGVDINGAVYVQHRNDGEELDQFWSHPQVNERLDDPILNALRDIVTVMVDQG